MSLLRAFEQQLHAETDAEHRLRQAADTFHQTGGLRCAMAAGARRPRQDHALGTGDDCRIGGQFAATPRRSSATSPRRYSHRRCQ